MREIIKKSSAKAVLELAEKIHDLTVRSVWTGTRCLPGWWGNEITVHRYIPLLEAYMTDSLLRRMKTFHCFSSPITVRPVVDLFSFTRVSSLST